MARKKKTNEGDEAEKAAERDIPTAEDDDAAAGEDADMTETAEENPPEKPASQAASDSGETAADAAIDEAAEEPAAAKAPAETPAKRRKRRKATKGAAAQADAAAPESTAPPVEAGKPAEAGNAAVTAGDSAVAENIAVAGDSAETANAAVAPDGMTAADVPADGEAVESDRAADSAAVPAEDTDTASIPVIESTEAAESAADEDGTPTVEFTAIGGGTDGQPGATRPAVVGHSHGGASKPGAGYTLGLARANAFNAASMAVFGLAYKKIAKPVFFSMKPDTAHRAMIEGCGIFEKSPAIMKLVRAMFDYTDPILETEVMGIPFNNPFGLTAGLDKDCDLPVVLNASGFGFETVGSTTARPCPGNPRPWFHRLPQYKSMVVHAGLANDGSDKVIRRAEKAWTDSDELRVSVSLARTNDKYCGDLDEGIEDYVTSMRRAAGRTDIIEINVSCPNTKVGEPFTDDPANLDRLFNALDNVERTQPVLVKMPLNKTWDEMTALLDVLAEHDVQGVSLANLQKNRAGLDVPADWAGGLSGGPCRQDSDLLVAAVRRRYRDRFTIAGIGGVSTPEDAYRKIRMGADLIQFVSALMYEGPQTISVLKRGLARLLRRDGFGSVAEAVGTDL